MKFRTASPSIQRMNGASILMITHGFEIAEKRDSFVELAEEAMESFSSVVRPGSFLVDWIPACKPHYEQTFCLMFQ